MQNILLVVLAILSSAPAVDIGLRKQLLVDDLVIAESRNLTRVIGTVTKANNGQPLRFSRRDAAGRTLPIDVWPAFATVYYDESLKKFRMWYRISFDDTSRKGTAAQATVNALGVGTGYHRAYAESSDGLHFEFVALLKGLTTSGDTNMVVTIDEHESDPLHRYKIGYDTDGPVHAAAVAHSGDGINWTPYNEGRPVTYRASDFTNQVIWDPAIAAYRMYTRTDFGGGGGPLAGSVPVHVGAKMLEVRGVRSMTNPDIKANPTAWTLERHWLLDGEEDHPRNRPPIEDLLKNPVYLERVRREALRRQIYMLTDWTYEGVHFGLMPVLEYPTDVSEGTETDQVTRHERSVENFYFITSRDGIAWNYRWVYAGKPLVPRGPTSAWDKDMIFPTSRIVTHDYKHWIFYGGNNERHGCAEKNIWFARQGSIGLAWLRLDGFAAMSAGNTPGVLTTKPFKLEGSKLELNVVVDPKGILRVEFLDVAGKPIPGFSGKSSPQVNGIDDTRFGPTWRNQLDLAPLKGQIVQLRIHLQNARIHAFQVRP